MQEAHYVRIYAGEDGESHFEDVRSELQEVNFAPPAAPLNVAQLAGASQTLWVGAQPGWPGDTQHPAPQRQIFVTSQGEYEVTASDGAARRFGPGAVLLLEDTWGKGHGTRITGEGGALVFAVVLS